MTSCKLPEGESAPARLRQSATFPKISGQLCFSKFPDPVAQLVWQMRDQVEGSVHTATLVARRRVMSGSLWIMGAPRAPGRSVSALSWVGERPCGFSQSANSPLAPVGAAKPR